MMPDDPGPTTIAGALREAVDRLREHDTARLDAEVLLAYTLEQPRSHLHARPERALSPRQLTRFRALVARRAAGEPVAHLTGRREFWSLSLAVTPDTLIPRPDTELLVEETLAALPADRALTVADLGTGSGAIALALAHERPRWRLYALDRSAACVRIARQNGQRLGIGSVRYLVGHWSGAFATTSLDAIVTNPPYVSDNDPHLRQGDVRFEPLSALTAGPDGLDDIRALVSDARRALKPGGHLLMEHAPDQTSKIHNLLLDNGFYDISTARDLAGHERVTRARRGD